MFTATDLSSSFDEQKQPALETLQLRRQELTRQLQAIDDQLARHPEMIGKVFSAVSGWEPQTLNVVFLQAVSGHTDSRKNMMPWSGYRFQLAGDDTVYLYRSGENWCSSFSEVGAETDLGEGESVYSDELEDGEDAPFAERIERLRESYQDYVIVAMYLKQITEG